MQCNDVTMRLNVGLYASGRGDRVEAKGCTVQKRSLRTTYAKAKGKNGAVNTYTHQQK